MKELTEEEKKLLGIIRLSSAAPFYRENEMWSPETGTLNVVEDVPYDNNDYAAPCEPYNFIEFTIKGDPIAQKRHRHVKRGNFVTNYDPSAGNKADFLSLAHKHAPSIPFTKALRVDVFFFFKRPKSHYKSGKNSHLLKEDAPEWKISKPDRDNCDKFVLDSLKGLYWHDDSIVCAGEIQKKYSDNPRTEIKITPL